MSIDLLTVPEVAAKLRKSNEFVLRELRRKNLRGARFGGAWHVSEESVIAYIEAHANVTKVRRAS